jgi:hypothetical protein
VQNGKSVDGSRVTPVSKEDKGQMNMNRSSIALAVALLLGMA